MELNVMLR